MANNEFDITSLSPEAYTSLVIDETLAPVVAAIGATAFENTLQDIANQEARDDALVHAAAVRGCEEAEEFANLGLIDGEMPQGVADSAQNILSTYELIHDVMLQNIMGDSPVRKTLEINARTGRFVDALQTEDGLRISRLTDPNDPYNNPDL